MIAFKKWSVWMSVVALCWAATASLSAEESSGSAVDPAIEADGHLPGVALAHGITEITGVAISPLLGVSGVGAYQYFKTDESLRVELPWYCQPWAWGTGLTVLALVFLKDSLGAAAPGILKKPFDMAELFENKLSGLVASAAFVPLVAREMVRTTEAVEVPAGMIGGEMMAMIDPSWITVPLSVMAFLAVWVCSHAINVLIIMSPFSTVDTLLKLSRMGLLALLGIAYWIAPWLGAAFGLGLIGLAIWMAPTALRLMIFGARFAGDVLLPWRAERTARPQQPHVFTLVPLEGLPSRMGGRLVAREDGALEFRYRPYGVLPERQVPLPEGPRHVAKGLISPAIFAGEHKQLLVLPRYRGREEEILAALGLDHVREHSWTRGWAAAKAWVRGLRSSPKRLGDQA